MVGRVSLGHQYFCLSSMLLHRVLKQQGEPYCLDSRVMQLRRFSAPFTHSKGIQSRLLAHFLHLHFQHWIFVEMLLIRFSYAFNCLPNQNANISPCFQCFDHKIHLSFNFWNIFYWRQTPGCAQSVSRVCEECGNWVEWKCQKVGGW